MIASFRERDDCVNYILDTNIILRHLDELLEEKSDCGIIIPNICISELDNQKSKDGNLGYMARKAIRKLFEIKRYGNLNEWIKLENNISLKVEHHFDDDLHLEYNCNDDIIIGTLSRCQKDYKGCVLLSNDLNICLKAEGFGFKTEQINFKSDLYKNVYKGFQEISVSDDVIHHFYERGYTYLSEISIIPYENEFVIMTSNINPKRKAIGVCCYGKIEKPLYFESSPSNIKTRNLEQRMAVELLMRDDIPMVSMTGSYGSSKTFLQLSVALEKVMSGKFKKILLVKPPMPLDKNLMVGYKKGDLFSKYLNTLGSITSNLEALREDTSNKFMNGVRLLEGYIDQGVMEIVSIEDILGSSYNNAIILAEEMQLLQKSNLEALLSRVGNSRIFINGDLKQGSRLINKDPREMGLYHMINVFKDSNLSGHLTLSSIQRSDFVKELSERW